MSGEPVTCPAMRVAQRIIAVEGSARTHSRRVVELKGSASHATEITYCRYAARDALQESDVRRRELAFTRASSIEGAEAQVLELVERLSALVDCVATEGRDLAEDDYRLSLRLAFSVLAVLEAQSGRSSQEAFGRSFGSYNLNPWLDPVEAVAACLEE